LASAARHALLLTLAVGGSLIKETHTNKIDV